MVSVVIPTYNRLDTLRTVLPCYLSAQGVTEVLVVDDGSREPVSSLLEPHERLRIVRNNENRGPCVSRNVGVREARSEFVFFADDDLLIPSDHISILLAVQKKAKADICCGVVVEQEFGESLGSAGERLRAHPKHSVPNGRVIFDLMALAKTQRLIYAHCVFLAPRELMLDHSFDETFSGPSFLREDYELWLRLTRLGYHLVGTPQTFALHMARATTAGAGTRQYRSIRGHILSALGNTHRVFSEYGAETSEFFDRHSKSIYLRALVETALIEEKRWLRYRYPAFNRAIQSWKRKRAKRT